MQVIPSRTAASLEPELTPKVLFRDGYELPDELNGEPIQEGDLRGMSSGSFAAGGQSDSLRKTEIEVVPVGELRGAEKGLVQGARNAEGVETDPAWKMSELYAA